MLRSITYNPVKQLCGLAALLWKAATHYRLSSKLLFIFSFASFIGNKSCTSEDGELLTRLLWLEHDLITTGQWARSIYSDAVRLWWGHVWRIKVLRVSPGTESLTPFGGLEACSVLEQQNFNRISDSWTRSPTRMLIPTQNSAGSCDTLETGRSWRHRSPVLDSLPVSHSLLIEFWIFFLRLLLWLSLSTLPILSTARRHLYYYHNAAHSFISSSSY